MHGADSAQQEGVRLAELGVYAVRVKNPKIAPDSEARHWIDVSHALFDRLGMDAHRAIRCGICANDDDCLRSDRNAIGVVVREVSHPDQSAAILRGVRAAI